MSNGPGNYFYKSGSGGGSGSGFGAINYITNFGAETDTTGWSTYADAPQNIPVDGIGGSAANLTFSRSTSSPLVSTASFSMVQANSTSLQGKGVSYDFTIDAAMQSTNLSIQFLYNASSTFVTADGITAPLNDGTTTTNAGNSDVEVFLYDVTNAVLIPVSPQVMAGKGTQSFPFKATFQTASNSTSYRLIFHVASTSANATGWTYKFDQVYVGPQNTAQGDVVTDWVAYTPTITGFGTTSAASFFSRRVGDSLEVAGYFTAGSNTAVTPKITLGYNGVSANVTSSTIAQGASGTIFGNWANAANGVHGVIITVQGDTAIRFGVIGTATAGYAIVSNAQTLTSTTSYSLHFTVPITGWASATILSNDTDTRVVAYRGTNVAGTSIANSGDVQVPFATLDFDSHGAFATPTYTVPVAGKYRVSATVNFASSTYAAGNVIFATIYKNGAIHSISAREDIQAIFTSLIGVSVEGVVNCVAGDTIDIRVQNTRTAGATLLSTTVGDNHLEIERLTGPSTIAATDTVAAAYTDTAGSVLSTTLAKYAYATKVFDTHSAYGNSGIYTVPISGKYLIQASLHSASTTLLVSAIWHVTALQNNTAKFSNLTMGNGTNNNYGCFASGILSCTAGDTLAIQCRFTTTGSTAFNTAGYNYLSINRIGN